MLRILAQSILHEVLYSLFRHGKTGRSLVLCAACMRKGWERKHTGRLNEISGAQKVPRRIVFWISISLGQKET
jgi:hypothetical protein